MFQKIREMEGKLELQRRQLKELEEKVGGQECRDFRPEIQAGVYLPGLGQNIRRPVPPNLSKKSRTPTGSQTKILPPQ